MTRFKIWKSIFLFINTSKDSDFTLGFTIGTDPETEHYCSRDIRISLGFYSFLFWLEDTE